MLLSKKFSCLVKLIMVFLSVESNAFKIRLIQDYYSVIIPTDLKFVCKCIYII